MVSGLAELQGLQQNSSKTERKRPTLCALGVPSKRTELGFFPNPASDKVSVAIASEKEVTVSLTVSNQHGGIVASLAAQKVLAGGGELELDAKALAAGEYFVSAQFEGGAVACGKLLVKK